MSHCELYRILVIRSGQLIEVGWEVSSGQTMIVSYYHIVIDIHEAAYFG